MYRSEGERKIKIKEQFHVVCVDITGKYSANTHVVIAQHRSVRLSQRRHKHTRVCGKIFPQQSGLICDGRPAAGGAKRHRKGESLGALGVNYRHSLRKRRGPKCRRRSFSLLFFFSCVCLSFFLSLFPFIYFPILRIAVGAAAAAVQEAWPMAALGARGARTTTKTQGGKRKKKREKKEKKKRMTAIKQANSSQHLSSIYSPRTWI